MNLYHAEPGHDHDNVLASNSSEAESSPFIIEEEQKCQVVNSDCKSMVLYHVYIYIHTISIRIYNHIYSSPKNKNDNVLASNTPPRPLSHSHAAAAAAVDGPSSEIVVLA